MTPTSTPSILPQPRFNEWFETEDEARFTWALYSLARYSESRHFPGDQRPVTLSTRGRSLFDALHQVDLAAYAGRFTELRQVGADRWKGLCPLHAERTASFIVSQQDGIWSWHCFGACATGGDIVALVRELKARGKI